MTDIAIANGSIKLAASVYGVDRSNPILFLHGISLSRDTWEEIALRMSNEFSVWTLDFRGHGDSDRASSYELAGYVSDAEATLAAIGRPAIVVGHSLGGVVADSIIAGALPLDGDLKSHGVGTAATDPPRSSINSQRAGMLGKCLILSKMQW